MPHGTAAIIVPFTLFFIFFFFSLFGSFSPIYQPWRVCTSRIFFFFFCATKLKRFLRLPALKKKHTPEYIVFRCRCCCCRSRISCKSLVVAIVGFLRFLVEPRPSLCRVGRADVLYTACTPTVRLCARFCFAPSCGRDGRGGMERRPNFCRGG